MDIRINLLSPVIKTGADPRITVDYVPALPQTIDYIEAEESDSQIENEIDPAKIIGKKIANTYEIKVLIGSGGMSYVYSAFDTVNKRDCAVKIMKTLNIGIIDSRLLKRFIREGATMQKLEHEHILPIYGTGNDNDNGIQYIAMKLAAGGTLRTPKNDLTFQQKLLIVADICDALHYTHEQNVIHRDIKPDNILLTQEIKTDKYQARPVAKLGDFGLVRDPKASRLSQSEDIIGTAYYMSPEQAKGGKNLTPLSDLYSIGIVLYELVTNKVPFDGNLLSVIDKHKNVVPLSPKVLVSSLPSNLETLIMSLLEKEPSRRHFISAGELALELRNIAGPKKKNPNNPHCYKVPDCKYW